MIRLDLYGRPWLKYHINGSDLLLDHALGPIVLKQIPKIHTTSHARVDCIYWTVGPTVPKPQMSHLSKVAQVCPKGCVVLISDQVH